MILDQRRRILAGVLLAALLLLMALRLGMSENLRESVAQKHASYAAATMPIGPQNPGPIPLVGPAFITSYAALALLLAGAAALVAGKNLSRARIGQWMLFAVIAALLALSAAHAANRFNAIVGTADIVAAFAAAWGLALLCDDALLGKKARQAALAAMIAILAMNAARALEQHFIEYPDTRAIMEKDWQEQLQKQGIDPQDPLQVKMFMARFNSQEVTGFGVFSNVFASESVALAGLAAGLLIAFALGRSKKPDTPPPDTQTKRKTREPLKSPPRKEPAEIPVHLLAIILLAAVGAMAVAVVPMTHSNGGMAAGIITVAAIACGGFFARQIATRRRLLLGIALGLAFAGVTTVIAYGITHHRLPSKSLMFRWQYWTASVPIIQQSPLWGTGLNNFGDYYLVYKAPSSPEDVKDPHSFFVRLAAEGGVPVALTVGALLAWMLWRAFAKQPPDAQDADDEFPSPVIAAAAVAGIAWALLRMLGLPYTDYSMITSFLFAAFGVLAFAAVLYLLWHLEAANARIGGAAPTRFVALAAVVAALGMFLYEQVNMALVTGPCAMLFWMMLAVGDASGGGGGAPARRVASLATAIISLAAGAATLFFLAIPLAGGNASFDPATHEYEYVRQYDAMMRAIARQDRKNLPDHAAAMQRSLQRAIELSPRSIELHRQWIAIQQLFKEQQLPSRSTVDEIRKVLNLDRANARQRLDLALPESDLPREERIAALEDALRFDEALPADEAKRLTEAQKKEVRDKIAALRGNGG